MKPKLLKTYVGILFILFLGLALFFPCLTPKSHSCSRDYAKQPPDKACDVFACHEPLDPSRACFSAGCMIGSASVEDAMAKCSCKEEAEPRFGPPCDGACRCECGYIYCTCGRVCCESVKLCQKKGECQWRGKEAWLELQKPKPIPRELLHNYQQGLALMKRKYWAEAIPRLKKAIDAKYIDRRITNWRDLTYEGFFPRRELGIAQYQLANYSEAIQALDDSLKGEETAKAQLYLNHSRSQHLKQTKEDKQAPKISLSFPVGLEYVNKLQGLVEGKVSDDFFVSAVSINGQKLPLWLAQKVVPFRKEIPLSKGLNEVVISAADLSGKISQQKVSIYADIDGPLISTNYQIIEQSSTSRQILLTGGITDDTEVQEVIIQNKTLSITPAKEVGFNQVVALPRAEFSITIQAKDKLGNITSGEVVIQEAKIAGQQILLAYSGPLAYYGNLLKRMVPSTRGKYLLYSSVMGNISAQTNYPSPIIELKDIIDQQTFFFADVYIEGRVRSANDIVSLTINQEPFWKKRGNNIFFSTILRLKEGENQIVVEAQDTAGNTASKKITLYRKIPRVKAIGSRMCITIPPFEQQGTTSQLKDIIYNQLISAFINQQRFNLVERNRLEEVLLEQKLSQTKLVRKSIVMSLGQILAADAVMIGTVYETEQTIEIYARLVDTGTGVIIDSEDAYGEGKNQEDIKLLVEGLALKFKNSFPLVEGLIIKRNRKNVFQDLGTQAGMKPYRKLIVYCEQEPIVHPLTQKILGADTEELGEIMVKKVFNYMSRGDIIREKGDKNIKLKDKVISK